MTIFWLTVIVMGAAWAAANLLASAAAWLTWPLVTRWSRQVTPGIRAHVILAWRLLPTVVSAAAAIATGWTFALHEPAGTGERAGLILAGLAAWAGITIVTGGARLIGRLVATRRLARAWARRPLATAALPGSTGPAWEVDSDFPLVAVVGFRRPHLVVARCVAERCTPEELAAIAAHEGGHVVSRDNLKRLFLSCACDGLSWTRRASDMDAAWQEAAEDAADDHAAASGALRLDLASALLTVARLAPGRQLPARLSVACFYRGDGVERRIRRLAGAPADVRLVRAPVWPAAGALAALVVLTLAMPDVSRRVYLATEWMIRHMP